MLEQTIQEKIDLKTKPKGALGRLEALALQICQVQNTLSPELRNPGMLVFAADHGASIAGLSAYPKAVTAQMVLNFLAGGAAINVFCRQHGIGLNVVDAGVDYEFPKGSALIDAKIALGTGNFLTEKAMSASELQKCFLKAEAIVGELFANGCNIIGFGEMGIGNTSSASLLMSYLCDIPIADCVGRGTGLDDEQLGQKIQLLTGAQALHGQPADVYAALQCFGGFEIAQIAAGMLSAYAHHMLIMVDGFIATVAFLCAQAISPEIISHAIFCHASEEKGHQLILAHLKVKPLLDLNMRLGEGTGCAVAFPIIQSAVLFMNEMASFEQAGVSNKPGV